MREQEVRDQHRLRRAEMRVRRHQRVAGRRAPARASAAITRGERLLQQRECGAAGTAAGRARPARCAIGRCAAACPASPSRSTSSRSTKLCTSSSAPSTNAGIRAALLEDVGERRLECAALRRASDHAGARERPRPREAAGRHRLRTDGDRSGTTSPTRRRPHRAPRRTGRTRGLSSALSLQRDRSAGVAVGVGGAASVRADDGACSPLNSCSRTRAGHPLLDRVDEGVERLAQRREPARRCRSMSAYCAADAAARTARRLCAVTRRCSSRCAACSSTAAGAS